MTQPFVQKLGALALALNLGLAANLSQAHPETAVSAASALSALPVAMSVTASTLVLSAGVVLTVASVEVVGGATVWVLQRASDGAKVVIRVASQVAGGVSVAVGAAVTVTAIGAGYILSAAGEVIAFVPNALGASLLYNERLTR